MTPERWLQIKRIFNAALAVTAENRRAFLANACGDDEKLCQEVESLLASHERTGSFIDSPVYKMAAAMIGTAQEFAPGQSIGHYEIISKLGEGGMGVVYLARDINLGRDVALKFLASDFTRSFDRLQRFKQEARAASALNHPNIITIYEIGEAEDQQFIATEFIKGETLRTKIQAGPMSVSETLNIVDQVGSALAAAHAQGIVHRDIKPENIMLRSDGLVKVLDFGLVKLTNKDSVGSEESTVEMVRTATGVVMGTTAYMSPEQTRGLQVDSRTDIWSLGAVIYEMLASKPPFEGATATDVLVSILEREPLYLVDRAKGIPAEFHRIVNKALRKDRDERYQTIRDMQSDLKPLRRELAVGSGSSSESKPTLPVRQTTLLVALILLLSIAGFVIYKLATGAGPSRGTSVVLGTSQLTTWPGLDLDPAISPDGNRVAYSSDHLGNFEIFVKESTPGAREIQLTDDGQQNFQPAWSPDGKLIAFHSKTRGGILVVPASGGTSRQLAETGSNPVWSPDGSSILFQSEEVNDLSATSVEVPLAPSTLKTVSATGGEIKSLTQVGVPAGGHGDASWSPDGKRIVFVAFDGTEAHLWTMAADGTDLRELNSHSQSIYSPTYSPDGEYIFFGAVSDSGAYVLDELAVSKTTGEAKGDPREILNGSLGRVKNLSISRDGKKIVYSAPVMRGSISALSLNLPAMTPSGSPVALTNDTSQRKGLARFSPDGKKIAFVEFRGGTNQDIWVMDADGRNEVQLTTSPAIDWSPSWLPDNDQVVFQSNREGKPRLWSISIRSGVEKMMVDPGQEMGWPTISHDGRQFVFNSNKSGITNLWVISSSGGTPKQLTFDKELMGFGSWSPDGNWLAFEMKRGADQQVAIMPSSGGPYIQLTSDHGLSWPHSWSPDGDKIAFAGYRNNYWNVYWVSRTTKEQKQLTRFKKLNAFVRYPEWDPSGKRIVYEYSESTGNIWVMQLK